MLIAVEGCIGAGKSTVAKGLAVERRSEALLEVFETNPFLSAFYGDPNGYATETEFTFLLLHFHQLKRHRDAISRSEIISDFHLGKDLLYAKLNLEDSRVHQIFENLHDVLTEHVAHPTLMICLSASTALLIERIRKRQRDYEMKIDPDYYIRLNAVYEEFFEKYKGRKLKILMDEWDFVRVPALFQKLSLAVEDKLKSP
ncbi:MAG TPA: deoxynucleoside kinase [Candidatus Binatia bacterium]|jgi:deoxyguanosine kinase|nr:deoxynucleoside kinase [Candidatus Binatia bacterium]